MLKLLESDPLHPDDLVIDTSINSTRGGREADRRGMQPRTQAIAGKMPPCGPHQVWTAFRAARPELMTFPSSRRCRGGRGLAPRQADADRCAGDGRPARREWYHRMAEARRRRARCRTRRTGRRGLGSPTARRAMAMASSQRMSQSCRSRLSRSSARGVGRRLLVDLVDVSLAEGCSAMSLNVREEIRRVPLTSRLASCWSRSTERPGRWSDTRLIELSGARRSVGDTSAIEPPALCGGRSGRSMQRLCPPSVPSPRTSSSTSSRGWLRSSRNPSTPSRPSVRRPHEAGFSPIAAEAE